MPRGNCASLLLTTWPNQSDPHPRAAVVVGACVISLALVGVTGCSRSVNREQTAKEIVRQDPEFGSVFEKYRTLANRIGTYERELSLKRSTIEQNIAQLRKDLAATTTTVNAKIAEAKRQMDPDQERLKLALSMAGEELYAKRFQRASLGRSIGQLRKAGKTAQATWTAEERARQDAQLNEMQRDATRLDQEIAALKEHVRLLKTKMLIIRF